MSVVENFATLSLNEQRTFAEALIKTINSKSIFTSDTNFTLDSVEVDELTGGLALIVDHADLIEVSRSATWTCDNEDDATDDPGYDADYENFLFEDAKKAFKTMSAVIDGFKVSLLVDYVDALETIEVEVDHISHEDSGIGDYEYWGDRGYDSRPYVEVKGTIVKACDCSLIFFVEPNDTTEAASEAQEEI